MNRENNNYTDSNYSESIYAQSRRSRNNNSSNRVAFTILLLLIISLGIGGIFFYVQVFQTSQNTYEDRLFVIEQNQSLIKEALKITDANFSDFDSQRLERMQFLDDEIRKLWNIANGRNKRNIASLEKDLGIANTQLKKVSDGYTKTIDELTRQLSEISLSMEEVVTEITRIGEITDQNVTDIEKITSLITNLGEQIATKSDEVNAFSDRISSLEKQRGDLNVRVSRVSEDINLLRSRMLSLENSIRLPVNQATDQGSLR